jgi:hypothetical protein
MRAFAAWASSVGVLGTAVSTVRGTDTVLSGGCALTAVRVLRSGHGRRISGSTSILIDPPLQSLLAFRRVRTIRGVSSISQLLLLRFLRLQHCAPSVCGEGHARNFWGRLLRSQSLRLSACLPTV